MAPYGITDAIMRFKTENKSFCVNLIEGESSKLKDLLREDKCELAFIRETSSSDDEFAKIPYTSDNLVAVLPSFHPLVNEKEISIEQLKDEDFLLLQPGFVLYNICIAACRKAGFSPRIIYTGQNSGNIIDLVGKGMGISLLMKKPILSPYNPKISIIDIKPQITTQIKLYYRKEAALSAAAKHFIDSIQLLD